MLGLAWASGCRGHERWFTSAPSHVCTPHLVMLPLAQVLPGARAGRQRGAGPGHSDVA